MAYRLKKSESVPEGIKRIVLEEIDSATEELSTSKDRDEAVHEARKSVKKIRGVVRLVQPELGRIYQRENAQLGEIGRRLSELRDATAIIEVFNGLLEKYKENLRNNALRSIRRGLETSKRDTEQAIGVNKTVQQAVTALRSMRKRVKTWPFESDGFEALAPGLKERYRRGRKAMALARKNQTPENFHEWRKRIKDHWYHVRLLESAWTDLLQARESSLKDLETWLGDDHNLVVLCGKIEENPGSFGEPADLHLFLALSTQYQKELRDNALSLGIRLYEEKSRHFTASLAKLWDAWHNQPDRLNEAQVETSVPPHKQPQRAKPALAKAKASTAA